MLSISKITWEKLGTETPKSMIESDATIDTPVETVARKSNGVCSSMLNSSLKTAARV